MIKSNKKSKDFDDNAFNQGSKKVPMPMKKAYGTGLPAKKGLPKMSGRKK